MKHSILSAGIFISILFWFVSCSDEPNATGISIIPDTLRIESIVSASTRDTTVVVRIGGFSSSLLTGKTGTYEARTIMEFVISGYSSSFIIDSAVVNLRLNYKFVDSVGALGFQAHNMARTWDRNTFTWDSVAGSYDATPSGSFLKSITPQDTIISFKLDTALARLWWQNGSGSMMFVPSAGSAIIAGFSNVLSADQDSRPELVVSYRNTADTTDTTLTIKRRTVRAVFVAGDDITSVPTGSYVQSGISRRCILQFDSLAVPPLASITEAVLEVAVDNSNSLTNSFTRDSVYVHMLRRLSPPYDSLALQIICKPVTESGQKYFRADIRPIVQQWISREPNVGLLLRTYSEFTSLDKFAIYNSASSEMLRPKIKITYTQLPK
jgi:hypothetical protein